MSASRQEDWNLRGIQAMQRGDREGAAKAFTSAIEAAPDDPVGYVNFGNLLAGFHDTERAKVFYEKALALDDKAATAFYGLAGLYYNSGRYGEAAALYEKALAAGLDDADGYYMLGLSLDYSGNAKLALPYLQRAAELAPADAAIRLAYGLALLQLELFEEALQTLREAAKLDAESAEVQYQLGVAYAAGTEDREAAMRHLQRAIEMDPEQEQARVLLDVIERTLQ